MNQWAFRARSVLAALLLYGLMCGSAQAVGVDPAFPRLDFKLLTGDSGVSVVGNSIDVDATVNAIITDSSGSFIPLTPMDFTLSGTLDNGFYSGSLSAGSYLTATFTGLQLFPLDGVGGVEAGELEGSLSYTGGSLKGSYESGDLFMSYTSTELFSTTSGIIGAVVPVPAAVWLFGSGLIALVSVARRREPK